MYDEMLTVLFSFQGVAAVRAEETHWSCYIFSGTEGLTADFTLILTIAAVIIVNIMMWSSTERADGVFRNSFSIATLDRVKGFTVFPFVVFKKKSPVLFDERFYDWELIDFEFFVLGRM